MTESSARLQQRARSASCELARSARPPLEPRLESMCHLALAARRGLAAGLLPLAVVVLYVFRRLPTQCLIRVEHAGLSIALRNRDLTGLSGNLRREVVTVKNGEEVEELAGLRFA